MKPMRLFVISFLALLGPSFLSTPLQGQVTSPAEQFGFSIGTDYELVNYTDLQAYWEKLAGESDRMVLDTIGETEEGRPQLMAIITSPINHANLDRYREIARSLALAEVDSEEAARELAREGKGVVWIDGGLHATEVVGTQQLLELVYRLNSGQDAETLRFLNDLIILAVAANPDGMELVSNWYYRTDEMGGTPEDRNYDAIPVLYHKYAGHDNNRDFYMGNLSETTNMLRVQYREWFPQIIYNHHQTGPQGTIMFAPPFRNPPNHFLDPLVMTTLDQVGSAMHHRFVQEGKGGTTMRSGAGYSIWWNGGLRTTPYFHNSIGLLTEIRGGPNPQEVPFVPHRQLATTDIPLPVEPGPLYFRTVIEYSQTANWAVMDYASRNKDILLYNIWRMGMNSVDKGSEDSWTVRPGDIYAAAEELGGMDATGTPEDYRRFLEAPEKRDPRGFIIPADQADFATAAAFANALIKNGVQVHRALSEFTVQGRDYPAGSLVVMAAQAYRPHVLDMFEPQDHPNDFAYPGGPPIPPYDATGWTLAFQMGVEFDAILDPFQGPFEPVEDLLEPLPGEMAEARAEGYLLRHDTNNAFTAVNRLQAAGHSVFWMEEDLRTEDSLHPAGTFFIPTFPDAPETLARMTRELGVDFEGVDVESAAPALELHKPRVGLWDRYGGSMPSGWVRFILEEFDFDFRLVFPQELDAGNLAASFDVLIFPDGAIPSAGPSRSAGGRYGRTEGPDRESIPVEYHNRLGSVTADTTIPRIREFLEAGGTVITLENSTSLGYHLDLPISNHLVDEEGNLLSPEEFFVPGSLLEVVSEDEEPVTTGMNDRYIVNFARSPVFSVQPGARGIRVLSRFQDEAPLRSGWAWGQEKLQGGAAMLKAGVGDGTLYLFGPQITYRGQTHETFPLLFNGILLSGASRAEIR
ncbi:MAG: M14 family metallopeptidase [Gemmatimonadota bacterium]